ncbi:MAG: 5' nucleotidase, NT5C type [Nanobdellota archaeon]
MRIAIDMDDVIADFSSAFIRFYNENYGTGLKKEEIFTYDLWRVVGEDKEGFLRKLKPLFSSDALEELNPLPGAVESLKELSRKHELIIVTARQEKNKEKTYNWIDKHLPGVFDKIVFTNRFNDDELRKVDVCTDHGASLIIEDNYDNARECLPHLDVILMDQPWNREHLEGARRVKSWAEIMEVLG